MTKFKVGDKAVVTGQGWLHAFDNGTEVIIRGIAPSQRGWSCFGLDKYGYEDCWYVPKDCLEKVEE